MTSERKPRSPALTESRQREILAAARNVFADNGFNAATMDMIAAQAKLAKGTLYLYFTSKDEVFWTVLSARFIEMLEATRRELAGLEGARTRLQAVVRARFDFMRRDEAFLRIYFTEFGHLCRPAGQFRQRFRELYNENVDMVAEILDDAVRRGEARPLPVRAAAMALLDLIRDVFAARLLDNSPLSDAGEEERFVFDLFWSGMGVSAPAPVPAPVEANVG